MKTNTENITLAFGDSFFLLLEFSVQFSLFQSLKYKLNIEHV